MKISRSTGYALVAVGFVAEASKEKPVMAAKISKEYGIPLEYLLKILQQLVRVNILRSKRGPRGGFSLARDTKEITILQIIEAVEGPMMTHANLAELTSNAAFSVKMEKACNEATDKLRAIYDSAVLSDMLAG